MTSTERKKFIKDLIKNVQDDLLITAVPAMPYAWDGHEIRQYIADRFQAAAWTLKEQRGRYRAYKNDCRTIAGL